MKVRLLAVALGLSLLANLFLIAKLRRSPALPAEETAAVTRLEARTRDLEAQLDHARRELNARPPSAPASSRTEAAAEADPKKPDPTLAIPPTLLETLKKLLRMMKESQKTGKNMDQEETREAWGVIAEYWPAMMTPSNKPGKYAEYIGAFLEASLHEAGVPLTEQQRAQMARLGAEVKAKLEAIPDAPGAARQLAEMEVQREQMASAFAAMTPEQRGSTTNLDLLGLRMGQDRYVTPENAVNQVVEAWGESMGLEPAQRPLLSGAAQMFAADLERIRRELDWSGPPRWGQTSQDPQTVPKMYDYRVRMMKAQMDALKRLEGSLPPEQRERFAKRRLTEFYPWVQ